MKKKITVVFFHILFSIVLISCQQGGDQSSNDSTSQDNEVMSGKVADGYLKNARVCLDRNRNYRCDDDEPSIRTDENGKYELLIQRGDQGKYNVLVEAIANETVDLDNPNTPITQDFYLSAPVGQNSFISPFTTILQLSLANSSDQNVTEVKKKYVSLFSQIEEIDLNDDDLTADYIEKGKSDQKYRALHRIAQNINKEFRSSLQRTKEIAEEKQLNLLEDQGNEIISSTSYLEVINALENERASLKSDDFKIYLPDSTIEEKLEEQFEKQVEIKKKDGSLSDREKLVSDALSVNFQGLAGKNSDPQWIKTDLKLPLSLSFDSSISWESSNPSVINQDGMVQRPAIISGEGEFQYNQDVILSAKLQNGAETLEKKFKLRVIVDENSIYDTSFNKYFSNAQNFLGENKSENQINQNLDLILGVDGVFSVNWESSNSEIISDNGIVNLPESDADTKGLWVTLYAKIVLEESDTESKDLEKEEELHIVKPERELKKITEILKIENHFKLTFKVQKKAPIKIETNGASNCILHSNKKFQCWGENNHGQFNISEESFETPDDIEMECEDPDGCNQEECEDFDRCDQDECEDLDDGCEVENKMSPIDYSNAININLPDGKIVKDFSVGKNHLCLLFEDGSYYCSGDNRYYQLNNEDVDLKFNKIDVETDQKIKSIVSGSYNNCLVLENLEIHCFGGKRFGKRSVRMNNEEVEIQSIQVPLGVTFNSIQLGESHSCAIDQLSSIYCWGNNELKQVSDDADSEYHTPTLVNTLQRASTLEVGSFHSCFVNQLGHLYCWGSNSNGQLGLSEDSLTESGMPARVVFKDDVKAQQEALITVKNETAIVVSDLTVVDIALGANHSCAITNDSSLWCWGSNSNRQILYSKETSYSTPRKISFKGEQAKKVYAGARHTCVLLESNEVECWGDVDDEDLELITKN